MPTIYTAHNPRNIIAHAPLHRPIKDRDPYDAYYARSTICSRAAIAPSAYQTRSGSWAIKEEDFPRAFWSKVQTSQPLPPKTLPLPSSISAQTTNRPPSSPCISPPPSSSPPLPQYAKYKSPQRDPGNGAPQTTTYVQKRDPLPRQPARVTRMYEVPFADPKTRSVTTERPSTAPWAAITSQTAPPSPPRPPTAKPGPTPSAALAFTRARAGW